MSDIKTEIKSLQLSDLTLDGGTQIRAETNSEVVAQYAALITEGVQFPPVCAVFDGTKYFLWDGFHRLLARFQLAKASGCMMFIDVEVTPGTRLDAVKLALGANSKHGLQRTQADKVKAIGIALQEFPNLSDRELGRICAVDPKTVGVHRITEQSVRLGADGKSRQMPKSGEEIPHVDNSTAKSTAEIPQLNQPAETACTGDLASDGIHEEEDADVAEEKPVNPTVLELFEQATGKLHAQGKEIISLADTYTTIANLQKSFLAKARQDQGELLAAAKAVLFSEKPTKEQLAAITTITSYWARFGEALIKLG